ncbi:MAG: membrane fusion protein (multidrug efflux system), partial [Janthinobacterium sp.]
MSIQQSTVKPLGVVAPAAESAATSAPAMPAPPNKRVLVIAGLIALIALGIGGRMWYRSHYFVETENAYVSGHLHPVSSRLSGVVTRLLIEDNQAVQ